MKIESWIFGGLAMFFVPVGVVYGFVTGWTEPVGFLALWLVGGLAGLIGGYLGYTGKRIGMRPEDRQDAEIHEGAGEQGQFSPWSWWPIAVGLSAAGGFLGLAIGFWILYISAGFALVALIGMGLRVQPRGSRPLAVLPAPADWWFRCVFSAPSLGKGRRTRKATHPASCACLRSCEKHTGGHNGVPRGVRSTLSGRKRQNERRPHDSASGGSYTPDPPQPGPRAARRRGLRRRRRHRVTQHAQARQGTRRRTDGAVQARRQQGRTPGRNGRRRRRRDRGPSPEPAGRAPSGAHPLRPAGPAAAHVGVPGDRVPHQPHARRARVHRFDVRDVPRGRLLRRSHPPRDARPRQPHMGLHPGAVRRGREAAGRAD